MKNNTLDTLSVGKDNNLNFIRFIAACLVIITHAYPLTKGQDAYDPCFIITNGLLTLGGVAVSIFFFYGGFLILKSMERLQKAAPYFKARILRIIPPLAFVTFILAFVAGPFLSSKDFASYFKDSGTYKYMLNSVLVLVHNLPGVFENNIYTSTVNGALWTLPVEFICYILCFAFFKLGLQKKAKWTIFPVFIIYFLMNYLVAQRSPLLWNALRPMMLFYMGMLCYIYRDKIKPSFYHMIIGFVILILGAFAQKIVPNTYDFLVIIAFPLILLELGFGGAHKFSNFGTRYELSYGMYLCAFPIQQSLVYFFPKMLPIYNMIISIPLAMLGGFLVNLIVEKPIQNRSRMSKHHICS